jgi:hypothetical protein
MEAKLQIGLENLKSEMNARLEDRLRAETGSLRAGIESTIRTEIEGVHSRFEAAIRGETLSMDAKLQQGLDDLKLDTNSRFESTIRNEIASVNTRCELVDTRLSATESRFLTETASQSELTVRTLRDEIERQSAATNSRLQSEIGRQCAEVSTAIRAELKDEREWVRKALAPGVRCIPLGDSPLDGIFAFLRRKCNGNVVENDVIAASPGTTVRKAFDLHDSDSCHYHSRDPDQWLAIDFRKMRVQVSDYSVQTLHGQEQHAPRSWVFEGSDDGATWLALDTRTGQSELQDSTRPWTFPVATQRYGQYLRFRKTEGFHSNCSFLYITAIEFHGLISGLS